MLAAIRKWVPLPDDDELVVRGNAAVQVPLVRCWRWAGRRGCPPWPWPGSLIPTTLAGHSYWQIEDPATRKVQRIQFHKNMAMIGGLLFAALDQPTVRP